MNRAVLRQLWPVCLLLLAGGQSVSSAAAQETDRSAPNLILIVADDMRYDALGAAGNRVIRTPHLDALANEGVRFRNGFATTAICAASRASILTGLYERTHRYTFDTKPITRQHWNNSYPAQLKRAGYRLGFVGKWGVNVEDQAERQTFDEFVPLNRTPYWKKQSDGSQQHLTDIEGERAIAFLKSRSSSQPFCLSLSFNAPHAEDADPRQYYWSHASDGLYEDHVFPTPRTMSADFFQRQPKFLQDSESRVRFHWRFDEPEKYQTMIRGYYRMITDVDRVVGRLRETLKMLGVQQQTVIVFTSDNGYFLGERGFADKWYLYEPSARVPLIIYDPRLKPDRRGQVVDQLSLNVDLAPTLLDLTATDVPRTYQGRSLKPLLVGTSPADWRTDFFYEHLFERPNIPKSEGVRTQQYTYIRWFERQPVVEELYDHQSDPDQAANLARDSRFAEVLATLRARTTTLRDNYGGPFVSNRQSRSKSP